MYSLRNCLCLFLTLSGYCLMPIAVMKKGLFSNKKQSLSCLAIKNIWGNHKL